MGRGVGGWMDGEGWKGCVDCGVGRRGRFTYIHTCMLMREMYVHTRVFRYDKGEACWSGDADCYLHAHMHRRNSRYGMHCEVPTCTIHSTYPPTYLPTTRKSASHTSRQHLSRIQKPRLLLSLPPYSLTSPHLTILSHVLHSLTARKENKTPTQQGRKKQKKTVVNLKPLLHNTYITTHM